MPTAAKQFSGNETWSRLNADPMLTMKRVEMDKVKNAHEKAKIARLQVINCSPLCITLFICSATRMLCFSMYAVTVY